MASGILLLEGVWDDQIENDKRISVSPLITYICKVVNSARLARFDVGTVEELKHRLLENKKINNFSTLYFAFHGRANGSMWIEDQLLTLDELAEIMGSKFAGFNIHFGSCSVGADADRLFAFKKNMGARLVSAYNIDADWVDTAALEVGWLSALISGRRALPKQYKSLAKKCGLVIV